MTASRYSKSKKLSFTEADGTDVHYYERRFLPQPETYAARGYARSQRDERTDILAWRTMQDPLSFWRIADANGVLSPADLVEIPGTLIKIPENSG